MDPLVAKELINDISVVLFHDDHGLNLLTVSVWKLIRALLHNLDVDLDLLLVKGPQLFERVGIALGRLRGILLKGSLNILGPVDLVVGEKNLTNVSADKTGHLILIREPPSDRSRCGLRELVELLHERDLSSVRQILHPGLHICSQLKRLRLGELLNVELLVVLRDNGLNHIVL